MFDAQSEFNVDFLAHFISDRGKKVQEGGGDLFEMCPDAVPTWLITTAMPSIQLLYRHGYLTPSYDEYREVLRMVVCLLARSVATICVDYGNCESGNPDLFLVSMFYMFQSFQQAIEEEIQQVREPQALKIH